MRTLSIKLTLLLLNNTIHNNRDMNSMKYWKSKLKLYLELITILNCCTQMEKDHSRHMMYTFTFGILFNLY